MARLFQIAMALVALTIVIPNLCSADAVPVTLTLQDLVNHPDRWPDSVKLSRAFRLQGGPNLPVGDKVGVNAFDGSQVTVILSDNSMFQISPNDCDLLVAANAAWTQLTPDQRALTPATLAKDRSLWPEKVKTKSDLIMDNNVQLPAGSEVPLVFIAPNALTVSFARAGTMPQINFGDCDVISRARDLVAMDRAKRPSRVIDTLKTFLVDSNGQKHGESDLDKKTLFLLYYGGQRCPRCVQISPKLVTAMPDLQAKYPQLQVVLMGEDEQTPDMLHYMTTEKMSWPGVPYKAFSGDAGMFMPYTPSGTELPEFVLVDKFGMILADSDDHRGHFDPDGFIQKLPDTLATSATKVQ